MNILVQLLREAGAFFLLDRGSVDFAGLYIVTQACAFFVTRAKKNMQFYRRNSRPVERSAGLRSDQTMLVAGVLTAQPLPHPLRLLPYRHPAKTPPMPSRTTTVLPPTCPLPHCP